MNSTYFRPALVIIVGVLGFLIAVAFNTTTRLDDARPQRASDLVGVVQDMERQRGELQERLATLRSQVSDMEHAAAQDSGIRETFTNELEQARALAGLSPVRGPGVRVMLGDGSEVAQGGDPNDYLIHDTDVAAVVNALLAAGAEAVDVNGERVVATTPVRCAGTTILVNSVRLGSPYTIGAIGDSAKLESALLGDPQASLLFTTYKSQYGLQVSISKLTEIEIAPYRGSLRPQYAAPLEEDGS